MKLNPKSPDPVRLLTTYEGKFLNYSDLIDRLMKDGVIDQIAVLMTVGRDQGDNPRIAIRKAVVNFIMECGRGRST